MLLRVIETAELTPVGASTPRTVDVRVIAATDARLDELIEEGGFSLPLYHRLSGCTVHLPPLRERQSDIGLLLRHFLAEELDRLGAGGRLSPAAPRATPWLSARKVARLALHGWPGNVRELRNVARQLALASHDQDKASLPPDLVAGLSPRPRPDPDLDPAEPAPAVRRRPADITDDELLAVLAEHRWSIRPAARALGISKTSLYGLIDKSPRVRRAGDIGDDELQAAVARHAGQVSAMAADLCVSPVGLRLRLKDLEP